MSPTDGQKRHQGQVLVLVALALVALLAIVALAVDGGHVYAERRKMQNAADAGALAGARVLCWETDATDADVEAAASSYAITYNGAHGAEVEILEADLTVRVAVTETTDTFFARVIGFPTVEVGASAAAQCQGPLGAGGTWPLAVGEDVYYDEANPNFIECGQQFYAYVSESSITTEACDLSQTQLELPNNQDCVTQSGVPVGLPDVTKVQHIDSGSRGWLGMHAPSEPMPDDCISTSCGQPSVACYITHGHPGPIRVGDCIYGESGNMPSLSTDVNAQCDIIHNLILFDRRCCDEDDVDEDPNCAGIVDPEDVWRWCGMEHNANSPNNEKVYHVSGFGCMRVVGWYDADFQCRKKNDPVGTYNQTVQAEVVVVEKLCENSDRYEECEVLMGIPTGELPQPEDPVLIQLIE